MVGRKFEQNIMIMVTFLCTETETYKVERQKRISNMYDDNDSDEKKETVTHENA